MASHVQEHICFFNLAWLLNCPNEYPEDCAGRSEAISPREGHYWEDKLFHCDICPLGDANHYLVLMFIIRTCPRKSDNI